MHPRFVFFPWQKDYSAQSNVFCPYAMMVGEHGYRSFALNIDQHGFRVQYDYYGEPIDLTELKQRYPSCTVLLGNSTSFGVSLTSDRKALGRLLSDADCPCINLSVRGATMQQELAIFQTFKHLLPPIRKLMLFSGLCDVSLATQEADFYSEAVGAFNNQAYLRRRYLDRPVSNDLAEQVKTSFLAWAELRFLRSGLLQSLFEMRALRHADTGIVVPTPSVDEFQKRLHSLLQLTNNVLETWSWIKKATGMEVIFFLQPVLGWTQKPLTRIEQLCTAADAKRVPAIACYANRLVFEKVHRHFDEACQRFGIDFHDANEYFDTLTTREGTLFTDICHLTDQGTRKTADWMIEQFRA
jgi:hypothetical protein